MIVKTAVIDEHEMRRREDEKSFSTIKFLQVIHFLGSWKLGISEALNGRKSRILEVTFGQC